MDENVLKIVAKREFFLSWIIFILSVIAHICVAIYAIIAFSDAKSNQSVSLVFSVLGLIITAMISIKILVTNVIPYTKDVRFYKDHDVERIRAVITKIRHNRVSSCTVTTKNLGNGEEITFEYVGNEVQKDEIYDFIYLKFLNMYPKLS